MLLEDQLADWAAKLDVAKPAGAPWQLSYSSTTRRVTIARTGAGAFSLLLPGSVGRWLGFTSATYTGATTYTGEAAPAGLVQCIAVDSEIATAHERAESMEYRHGRAVATVWGKLDRFKVVCMVRRDQYPWQAGTAQIGDDDPRGGWVLTGRVRLHQSGGDPSEYTAVRINGHIDGFVQSCTATMDRDDDGLLRVEYVVVRAYTATGADEPTGFWGAVKYGWNPDYLLTIGGVAVVWCERETGKTLASGYSESAALVIDDSAAVGSLIDRNRGVGTGLSLGFKLLDTSALAAYMVRPAHSTYLTADMDAAGAGAIIVADTTGFAGSGAIYIGAERIEYTATTGTTFQGVVTRGAKGSRKAAHRKGGGGQMVTDGLRWWQGRDVILAAVPIDPSGYVTGTALTDDRVEIWRGRIEAAPLRSFDGWNFTASALDRVLERKLAAKITGKVIGFENAIAVDPALNIRLVIDGVDSVGVSVWAAGPYTFDLYPFATYTAGDVISAGEARAAIDNAWVAAITALGAGAEIGEQLYWLPNNAGGFVAMITILANVNVINVVIFESMWFGVAPVVPKTWPPQPSAAVDWQMHAGWSTAANVLDLIGSPAYSPPLVVQVDGAQPGEVPVDGFIKVTTGGSNWRLFQYSSALASDSYLYLGYTSPADNGPLWQSSKEWQGATVELWAADGPYDVAVLMLHAIESSGGAAVGTYDTLAEGAGYGISEVDEDSFLQKVGAFQLTATVSTAGTSFVDLFGGVCALCRYAVVQRADTADSALAVKLACVETSPDGSDWQTEITDFDLLHVAEEPVANVQRLDPPNFIKATRIVAWGTDSPESVQARDIPQIAARGESAASWDICADSRDDVAAIVAIRAPQHFAAEQDAQALTLRVPPWVVAEPGDLIYLSALSHPSIYDYASATAGYTGVARVTGRAMNLRDCTVELTVLLAGQFTASGLCPSALVLAHAGPAGAATSIDVEVKYYAHFAATLSKAGGNITLLHYLAGDGEGTGSRYIISAAELTAGVCRLTVAAQTGVFSLASNSYVTLPPTATFGATAYQDGFAHADDGTNWT
jgi:hypothetical protein